MQILIANDFPPVVSGIATVFHQTYARLACDDLVVLAPRMARTAVFDRSFPHPVHRLPVPLAETGLAKLVKTLVPAIWVLRMLLVSPVARLHCGQVFSSGVLGLLCRWMMGIPYVVYVYGSETARLARGRLASRLMRNILESAERVVTNSEVTNREFLEFGIPPDRLFLLYPGVDTSVFAPSDRDTVKWDAVGASDRPVILTVARLDQRKGHDVVIRALAETRELSDTVYLIGGRGREEDRLRALADERGVADRVRFLGFVPDEDLPALYNLCDVFVMPNRVTRGTALEGDIEGFGITFIEAAACGKPSVAGRSGGAVEAVLHDQTGLLVDDPESASEVGKAIADLLSDPGLRDRLGRAGRARVERELDWKILAARFERALAEGETRACTAT